MKPTILILTFLFGQMAFASGTMEVEKKTRKALPSKAKKSLLKVFQANEKLMMSFFKYDEEKILFEKGKVTENLKAVKEKSLQSEIKAAIASLEKIAAKKKKEENYEAYHDLSKVLVKMIESYDLGSTYNVYYCPMVRKKWVQNSVKRRKVHNPYAPEMPHCGGQLTEY